MFPLRHSPVLRFGTVTHGSTEEVIKNNHPEMHHYMQKFMEDHVSHGIKALKDGYLKTHA